jgi:hypothetical protein
MRCQFTVFVLLRHAVPLYAGLCSMAQTTERSQREIRSRVGTPCSLNKRAMAWMLKPQGLVFTDLAYNSPVSIDESVRRGVRGQSCGYIGSYTEHRKGYGQLPRMARCLLPRRDRSKICTRSYSAKLQQQLIFRRCRLGRFDENCLDIMSCKFFNEKHLISHLRISRSGGQTILDQSASIGCSVTTNAASAPITRPRTSPRSSTWP